MASHIWNKADGFTSNQINGHWHLTKRSSWLWHCPANLPQHTGFDKLQDEHMQSHTSVRFLLGYLFRWHSDWSVALVTFVDEGPCNGHAGHGDRECYGGEKNTDRSQFINALAYIAPLGHNLPLKCDLWDLLIISRVEAGAKDNGTNSWVRCEGSGHLTPLYLLNMYSDEQLWYGSHVPHRQQLGCVWGLLKGPAHLGPVIQLVLRLRYVVYTSEIGMQVCLFKGFIVVLAEQMFKRWKHLYTHNRLFSSITLHVSMHVMTGSSRLRPLVAMAPVSTWNMTPHTHTNMLSLRAGQWLMKLLAQCH